MAEQERGSSWLPSKVRSVGAPRTSGPGIAKVRHAESGAALKRAIEAAGSSNCAVARALDRDEKIVRRMIAGELPISLDQMLAMPADVRHALAAELRHAGSWASLPIERQTLVAGGAMGDLAAAVANALADGVVTYDEAREVRRRAFVAAEQAQIVAFACGGER